MLQGNKNNIMDIKPYLSVNLQKALEYIMSADFGNIADGEYEIDGRNVFARISTYDTEAKEVRRAEKHEMYIDVQYVAAGSETIWYTPLSDNCIETENNAADADVIFYQDPKEKNSVILNAGDFAIFFPWELHRPNCANECQGKMVITKVKKIVVKVRA